MIIELNKTVADGLSKTELDIIKFINENEAKLSELSIVDIAFETYSSPSTVSRAIRKCGLEGFQELRYRSLEKNKHKDVHDMTDIMNKSLIEAQQTLEQISVPELLKMIGLINNADKVYIFARGLSEYVAEEFSLKLQLLNYSTVFIRDPNIMKKCSKRMKTNELLIIFSLNGETDELVVSSRNTLNSNANVALCCCNENSPIKEFSQCNLIGFQHINHMIADYEVASRIPLQMIARMIIDYIVLYQKN